MKGSKYDCKDIDDCRNEYLGVAGRKTLHIGQVEVTSSMDPSARHMAGNRLSAESRMWYW